MAAPTTRSASATALLLVLSCFAPATPIPGLYLCGAATHPGGSVIAANGRNAAMAILASAGPAVRRPR